MILHYEFTIDTLDWVLKIIWFSLFFEKRNTQKVILKLMNNIDHFCETLKWASHRSVHYQYTVGRYHRISAIHFKTADEIEFLMEKARGRMI